MRFIIIAVILIGCITEVHGALPPLFQGKREIETILSSKELTQYIPAGDLLEQITKTPTGYMIITNKRVVAIIVNYQPAEQIGPAKFSLQFQTLIEFQN
jgi:hypothetical protein